MLPRLVFLAALPLAFAQNATYLAGLAQTLASLGVTTFASIEPELNTTAAGQNFLKVLSDGKTNVTLFAPNDAAFASSPANLTDDPQTLADVASYHLVSGNFTGETATAPNVTVGRTYLNDPSYVALEGNKSQVLVWTKGNDSMVHILNQATTVTVTNTGKYGPISINVIDSVLTPPMSFSSALSQAGLTGIMTLLSAVPYTYYRSGTPVNTTFFSAFDAGGSDGIHGYTFFVPNDAAISAAAATLAGLTNITAATDVVQNHIINGTSVYSPSLINGSPSYTSAAGEKLSFTTNSSGTFVQNGNSQARIVQTDVLVNNGVIHVIDGILLNEDRNAGAASSAYASATSAATQHTSTETGPLGTPTSTSSSKSGGVILGFGPGHAMAVIGMLAGALLA